MQGSIDTEQDTTEKEEFKSSLVSRNITIMGRRTSVRLEPEMWTALREISKRERCTIHDLCTLVSVRKNTDTSLTAAIRVFLMLYFRAATTEEGHARANHGNFDFMKKRAKLPDGEMIHSEKLRTVSSPIASYARKAAEGGAQILRL